jgi:hypothetical protein
MYLFCLWLGIGFSHRTNFYIPCSENCCANSFSPPATGLLLPYPDQCPPIPYNRVVLLDRVEGLCTGHAPVFHWFGFISALCGQILDFVQG